MKKIFLLIFGFIMFKVGYSQYPIQQFIGSDSAIVTSKGAMQSRFVNVVFVDTTAANSQRIKQYPGAMIYASGNMWVRNTTATGWVELAYGPISTTNIYNADGSLTGNRELDGDSKTLTFTAVRKFQFSGDSLYYLLDPAGNLRLKLGNQQFTMQGDTASLSRKISYTSNLGSSFTKHSVVDKNYVDSSITASPSGTVTSVATNAATGITGGAITTTGTLSIDTSLISTRAWRQKGIDSVTSLINARPSGSGTTNYLSKWTSSTALGNSLVQDDGSNVGIGTAPTTIGAFRVLSINSTTGSILDLLRNGTSQLQIQTTSSTNAFAGQTNMPMSFQTNGSLRMQITGSTGNVIIGGTFGVDAGYKLDVNGTARVTTSLDINTASSNTAAFPVTINVNTSTGYAAKFNNSSLYNTYLGVTSTGFVFANANLETVAIYQSVGNLYNAIISGKSIFNLVSNTHTFTITNGGAVAGASSLTASAVLEATSTTKGFLPPRMTGAQAEAIATPAAGLMVYANNGNGTTITSIGWWGYNGTTWVKIN